MSRYQNSTPLTHFAYGYDACGIPGYFVMSDKNYDTRRFMADVGCHVSRGDILDILNALNDVGADVPEEHLMAIAFDLPF